MPKQRIAPIQANSCNTPIYQTSTYYFRDTAEVIDYHEKRSQLGRYGRYSNPNWTEFEQRMAVLEGAEDALLMTTGMTAIAMTLMALVEPGDTVVFTDNCYRNTRTFCNQILSRMNVTPVALNSGDPAVFEERFRALCKDRKPRVVFLETPSNPHMHLLDIQAIKEIMGGDGLLIVDSTFSSPINFRPMDHGADLVIHSCTKYIGGHGDLMAGCVLGSRAAVDRIRVHRNVMGGIVDPQTAALLNRSLDTLGLRMAHFNTSGMTLARYLEAHPRIARVYYTGLDSYPQATLANRMLSGHGGVVSFDIDGDSAQTTAFVEALTIPFMGSNFGASNALVEQCSIFTYYACTAEERADLGISDQLIRYSVGYEPTEELIRDIDAALTHAFAPAINARDTVPV